MSRRRTLGKEGSVFCFWTKRKEVFNLIGIGKGGGGLLGFER